MKAERVTMLRLLADERPPTDLQAQAHHIERLREALAEALDAFESIEAPIGGEFGRAVLAGVEGLVVERLNGRALLSGRVSVQHVGVTYLPTTAEHALIVDVRLRAGVR